MDHDFDDLLDMLPPGPEIPEDLFSVETGEQFARCLVCERPLASSTYAILKDVRSDECVLECAICTSCVKEMHESYSEESRLALTRFAARGLELMIESGAHNLEERCELCARAFDGLEEYSIRAFCRGESLLDRGFICTNCENEMHECLSKKTRDERDGFIERHFPGMPGELMPTPDLIPILG